MMQFVVLMVLSCAASAESIEYEIYEVSKIGSRLIAKGTREYKVSDVKVFPYESGGRRIAEKFVDLENGYRIGARIFQERKLTGFGLLAQRSDDDFSWDWYDQEAGDNFRKRQGGTYVAVRVVGRPFFEELAEVTFTEHTILRFRADRRSGDDTHHIHVKAGSVLRFR